MNFHSPGIGHNGPPPDKVILPTFHPDQVRAWNALYPYQRKALRAGRRWGKALAIDTPIPTPRGWTLMGDLRVGDIVFDETGAQCHVTYATEVQFGRPCNEVRFSDGSTIIADDDHRWLTWDHPARKNNKRTPRAGHGPKVRTTSEIAASLTSNGRGDSNHSVPTCGAAQCEEAALPINPYVLGVWLGDGTSRLSEITCDDPEILDELRREGQFVAAGRGDARIGKTINFRLDEFVGQGNQHPASSLIHRIRSLGLFKNKHIPPAYARASASQRMALLQGLMDTDGTASKQGNCEFTGTNRILAHDVLDLVLSLGIRATMSVGRATIYGKDCGPKYRIKFTTSRPVFRLPRKLGRLATRKSRFDVEHRFIRSVTPIESVPVRCIQVDSPNHLYLAGRSYIPTHNTDFAKIIAVDTTIKGGIIGWFAPDYKILSEAFNEIVDMLGPARLHSSKTDKVIRTVSGGRFDFWTLDNERAGRSRRYHGAVVDEGAFGPKGEAMMHIWDESIEPTLLDYSGWALACSNTAGNDPENWFWRICNEKRHGWVEFHAPSINNPTIPRLKPGETPEQWMKRREKTFDDLRRKKHPLVFAQEYMAEFVDWSGVAFFDKMKLLVNGQPAPDFIICDTVYAIVDSAAKTGSENDGTAVIYFALSSANPDYPLVILDWDIAQIEGALLETWLPTVQQKLLHYATQRRARFGSSGVHIEDKSTGIVLIQQAVRRNMNARAIDSQLTAMGKDERALNVSGYVYTGKVKLSQHAYDKVTTYKGVTRNHLLSQVLNFRMADKDAGKREDDLLDGFTYGIAIGLGNSEGF